MAVENTLIQIRERSYLDTLDLALALVRSRPGPLALAALGGVLPFAALNVWVIRQYDVPFLLYVGLLLLEVPWATAPLTVLLGGMMFGERPTALGVARTILRALPGMIAYQLLLRAALVGTVVLYPVIPARLTFMNEVILLERSKLRGAVKRCSKLSGQRGADLFGQWLAQLAFGAAFIFCFWIGAGAVADVLTSRELSWDEPDWKTFFGIRFHLASWLAVAFFGVARFLSYIDQRIRLEGWEVKLRLQAVGRTMEEADRWA